MLIYGVPHDCTLFAEAWLDIYGPGSLCSHRAVPNRGIMQILLYSFRYCCCGDILVFALTVLWFNLVLTLYSRGKGITSFNYEEYPEGCRYGCMHDSTEVFCKMLLFLPGSTSCGPCFAVSLGKVENLDEGTGCCTV